MGGFSTDEQSSSANKGMQAVLATKKAQQPNLPALPSHNQENETTGPRALGLSAPVGPNGVNAPRDVARVAAAFSKSGNGGNRGEGGARGFLDTKGNTGKGTSLGGAAGDDTLSAPGGLLSPNTESGPRGFIEQRKQAPNTTPTDFFKQNLVNPVKSFQRRHDLKVDGTINPGGPTLRKLNQALSGLGKNDNKPLSDKQLEFVIRQTKKPAASASWSPSRTLETPDPQRPTVFNTFRAPGKAKITTPPSNSSFPARKSLLDIPSKKPGRQLGTSDPEYPSVFNSLPKQDKANVVMPQGETVNERIMSMMKHSMYADPASGLRKHVADMFDLAYAGKTKYDAAGRMIREDSELPPKAIQPFDPEGVLANAEKTPPKLKTKISPNEKMAINALAPIAALANARTIVQTLLSYEANGYREILNRPTPKSQEEAIRQGYHKSKPEHSVLHNNNIGNSEVKFVHPSGREVVFDGDTGKPLSDLLGGTFNHVNYPSIHKNTSRPEDIARLVGHTVLDVLPYFVENWFELLKKSSK